MKHPIVQVAILPGQKWVVSRAGGKGHEYQARLASSVSLMKCIGGWNFTQELFNPAAGQVAQVFTRP